MKKTLIALLALSGLAMGDTAPTRYTGAAVNAWLASDVVPHSTGKAYTLTFKIDEDWETKANQESFFKLNSSWAIHLQQGKYVGLKNSLTGTTVSGDFASRNGTESAYDIDMDTTYATKTVEGEVVNQAQYQGWFYQGSSNYTSLAGATFIIHSSNARGTNITLKFDDDPTTTTTDESLTINLQRNGHTALSNLAFLSTGVKLESASVDIDGKIYVIPEPTTATLSLLALAGLAARRRRK